MLKQISMLSAFVVLAAGAARAQENGPVWQKVEVPGTTFSVVFAISESPRPASELRGSPDPLVVYPAGSDFAFALEGEAEKLLQDVSALQSPACAFRVERKGGSPIAAIGYVIATENASATAAKK